MIDITRHAKNDDKPGLIYPVHVRLDASDIMIDGIKVAIAPGRP